MGENFRVGDRVVNTISHGRGTVLHHNLHKPGASLDKVLVEFDATGDSRYMDPAMLFNISEEKDMEPEFEEGQHVTVKIPGVIDYVSDRLSVVILDGDDEFIINVPRDSVEVLEQPNPQAGQMFRKANHVFVALRTTPVIEGGKIEVRNVLTGRVVDPSVLHGAKLIADSEELR